MPADGEEDTLVVDAVALPQDERTDRPVQNHRYVAVDRVDVDASTFRFGEEFRAGEVADDVVSLCCEPRAFDVEAVPPCEAVCDLHDAVDVRQKPVRDVGHHPSAQLLVRA